MLFNSYGFIFAFFPLVLAGLFLCRRLEGKRTLAEFETGKKKFRFGEGSLEKGYLLAVSLIFYGWRCPEYLPVLVGSMAVNYGLGWQMQNPDFSGTKRVRTLAENPKSGFGRQRSDCGKDLGKKADIRQKGLLAAGIAFNLALLGVFKYRDTGGFVPLGISFFTFTQIACLTECCRRNLKGVGALSYGVYVSFFPKMMQGPIALPGEFFSQADGKKRNADWEKIYRNLYLFILGLSKKALLADTLGKAVDFGYGNPAALNSGDALIVMLSYTLQLYFDFSGYCDMAMGIAGMMGYELPLNFDSPYKASNILEFWKRWHITLTGFFTRYLYIPLGGNRKGRVRTYVNCLIVFFLSGIWHGSGWQFIVWGMMHGALFVLTRAWQDAGKDAAGHDARKDAVGRDAGHDAGRAAGEKTGDGRGSNAPSAEAGTVGDNAPGARTGLWGIRSRLVHALCVLATFLYVNIAWIFFRAPSVKEAVALIKNIAGFSFGRINWELAGCFNLDEFWYVIKVLRIDSWQYAHYILMVLFLAAVLLLVFFAKTAVCAAREVKPGVMSSFIMAVLFVWSVISFSGVSTFLYVNF